jgi:hypothetical protein
MREQKQRDRLRTRFKSAFVKCDRVLVERGATEAALLSIVFVILLMLVIGSFSIRIMVTSVSTRENTEHDRANRFYKGQNDDKCADFLGFWTLKLKSPLLSHSCGANNATLPVGIEEKSRQKKTKRTKSLTHETRQIRERA